MSVLEKININAQDITVLKSAKDYHASLLSLIAHANKRIYITALYLQDDDAGQEILHALYQAKQKNPAVDIKIFVDFHRAQRGLIGEKKQLGNRSFYLALAEQYSVKIDIYGVAVKAKELLGVLHLKGMIFDDVVFYTGASINDVYLHTKDRYRLDRYVQISSADLAHSFCQFLNQYFVKTELAPLLNQPQSLSKVEQKKIIKSTKNKLKTANYYLPSDSPNKVNDIQMLPLVGYGRRKNNLNKTIRELIQNSQCSLLIFTPYFNLPKTLTKDLVAALKRGVNVTLIIGDKTANDFYLSEDKDFSTIGVIPYMYEILLRHFIKRWQCYIDKGLLTIKLWKDGDNSFHLKGIVADETRHLITGSNLNPRAWSLDLENGILLEDPAKTLLPAFTFELDNITQHTQDVSHYQQLDTVSDYPAKPQKILKRIQRTQLDRILKRFL